MVDDIREAAIEAACRAFTAHDMPSFSRWTPEEQAEVRANMARAIDAYERAMWRPEGEADAQEDVLVHDGSGDVAVAFREDGDWFYSHRGGGMVLRTVTHFRPLPAPPEDAK